ncbi:MAG: chloride channel protein [Nitrososphaerales archaeon]
MKPFKYLDRMGGSYLRKWVPLSILTGIISGFGAIILYYAIIWATNLLLWFGAEYMPPSPVGEGSTTVIPIGRPYLLPLITTLGGLLSGIIIYSLAPEAEGDGVDRAVDAFHNKQGEVRRGIPIIKLIASAITIGSGGSAGREGPAAQISAGFGSVLGKLLHLNVHDRRIIMAAGIGAGLGSIFKAPFGGAILGSEILYKRDFEVEALIPSFIASITGYSIFASVAGWTPVFGYVTGYAFTNPLELNFYAILGLLCGLVGILYVKTFYGLRTIFKKLKIPGILKPTLGGFLVGLMAIFLPQVMGMGYGWLQLAIDGNFVFLPFEIMLLLIFAKIFATALSVGSGGSGGVFAPSLVIGGMIGGVTWYIFHNLLSFSIASPAPFVIVGMMAFFGGVGKVPISVILMVSEMTGTYTLLVPSVIATILAYLISGDISIYESQVYTRAQSMAHRAEYSVPLLEKLKVEDAMMESVITVRPNDMITKAAKIMADNRIKGLPVLKDNNLVGIITLIDILRIPDLEREKTTVEQVMSKKLIVTYPDESLYEAFEKMIGHEIGRLPVMDRSNPKKLIGIITRGDIGSRYELEVHSLLESAQ